MQWQSDGNSEGEGRYRRRYQRRPTDDTPNPLDRSEYGRDKRHHKEWGDNKRQALPLATP
jgi:hypothetical protein